MKSCRQPAMNLQRKRLSIIICQSGKKATVISERFIIKALSVELRLQFESKSKMYVFQQQEVVLCLLGEEQLDKQKQKSGIFYQQR